jgi:transcriptional regulator with XRE-family HTH domain
MAGGTEMDVRIGEAIRARRLDRGLSAFELAEAIGASEKALARFEGGQSRISAATLLRIAGALRCSSRVLFGEPDLFADPEAVRLVGAWSLLDSDSMRLSCLDFLEALTPNPNPDARL